MAAFELRRSSLVPWLLALLLLWAVGLRLWYASKDLNVGRFWDEKYSVPNLHAALERGELKPVRYAYLRLTYLPQVAVLGSLQTGLRLVDPEFSWFTGETLRPAGLMACRAVQVLLGGVSILLTFLLGRRLFTPTVGLIAAFLVAASPTHLILSVIFKPDILALATTLIAFLASLAAVDRPSISRYLLAGFGIGLAVSSKPTAGIIAIPLAMAAVILGFRDRRHWIGLCTAGISSSLLFLALNPYSRYLSAFALQRKRYTAVAARKGTLGDPLTTLHHELATVFKGAHGPWIGAAAVAGLLLLSYQIWRHRDSPRKSLHLGMLLIYPVSFLLLYGAVTQNVLPQNFLPLLPFTSLAAALFLTTVWQQASGRVRWLGDRRVVTAIVVPLVILASIPVNAHAYRILVPTTEARAYTLLASRLSPDSPRWIRVDAAGLSPANVPTEPGRVKRPPAHLLEWRATGNTDRDRDLQILSDAVVLRLPSRGPAPRTLEEPTAPFDHQRESMVVRPGPFRSWGPALAVQLHPWKLESATSVDLPVALSGTELQHRIAAPADTDWISAIEIALPRQMGCKTHLKVEIDGRSVAIGQVARRGRKQICTTDRFRLVAGDEVVVSIGLPDSVSPGDLRVVVRRWSRSF